MSGFSRFQAAAVLGHTWKKAELAFAGKVFLALCTTVPTNSSTGVTIVEATGATGYARKEVPVGSIASAVEGSTSSIKTSAELIFAEITAGEATVIGWALCDKGGTSEGNVVMWGTCTSTVISKTQTPPKVASGNLEGTLV